MTEQCSKFSPGQVVRLTSGGPAMTIGRHEGGNVWSCVWMSSGGAEVHHARFVEEMLEPSKPDVWPFTKDSTSAR